MKPRNELTPETWYMAPHIAQIFKEFQHLGQRKKIQKGKTLYCQGDIGSTFYFILSGRIQVQIFQQDGTEFILELMGPGALIGEGSAMSGRPRASTAICLDPSEIIEFNYPELKKLFTQHIELATALLEVTAIKQWVLGMRIQFLATPRPDLRIFELLSRLAALYGVQDNNGIHIQTPLTHELIASLTGTSRVTVTRTLAKLKSEGSIRNEGRLFWVRTQEQQGQQIRHVAEHSGQTFIIDECSISNP